MARPHPRSVKYERAHKKQSYEFMTESKNAIACLLLPLMLVATRAVSGDLSENNAADWGVFASDEAAASVSNDTSLVRAGSYSLRLDTASGFDTGVTYPADASAHWDLSTNTHLVFWSYGENTNIFQDNQPVVVLRSPGGHYRYVPDRMVTINHQWTLVKVPLAGDAHWERTASGTATLTNVTQLEIHQDTWDSGFTMFYDGVEFVTLATNGPTAGPPPPAGVNPDAIVQRVLLFIHDPIMENKGGQRMHEAYHWGDPQQLTEGIIGDFNTNSHGLYLPHIVETRIADEYPALLDGFRYDDASYDTAIQTGAWHDSGFDYWRFMVDNDLVRRVESGDLDEIWVYGFPGGGMWESTFAGQGGYWCNSSPVAGATNKHLAVIMGWNFERGVSEALESFGHRSESILRKIYDDCWEPSRINAWSAFTLLERNLPGLGAVGNVHYPVNGQSDYDWANTNLVWSDCDSWLNYPYLTNAARLVNYREWAPDDSDISRNYLNWWYGHSPHVSGKAPSPDDRLNNWWRYLIDVDQFKAGNGTLVDSSGLGYAGITAPANGGAVAGLVPVTVDATVDGALGRADLYVDGVYYASDSLAPFSSAWNSDGLLGAHTLVARAYELQTGAETVSVPVTVNVLGATIVGTVLTNTAPMADVAITARGTIPCWLRQSASPSLAVPDNNAGGITNAILISATGTVVNANVGVTVRHPRRSDLRVCLLHPSGAGVLLRSAGGSSDPNLITFYPERTAPEGNLASLVGLSVSGTWHLVVADLAGGATGLLESWSLALDYAEPLTRVTSTDASGHYSLTNLPAGDYELRPTKAGLTFLPIITNVVLSAAATNADFVSGPNTAPSIVTPPQTQTAVAGASVTLTVAATGTGPLTYQWFYQNTVIPGATASSLALSNLLVANSGLYSVTVSNPMPAGATATARLSVVPTPWLDDSCEGNAALWSSFTPEWEGAASSVSNDATHVKAGSTSIRFDTTSGFDTGVTFPKDANAHWDLRGVGWLAFWAYADNANEFQDAQPLIKLNCVGGSLELRPNDQLMANHDWSFFRIPLCGNAIWTTTTNGLPDLTDANQLEIHQDTWGAGFTIYYDALRFEPRPVLSAPEHTSGGPLQIRVTAPVGVSCRLQTSTNQTEWLDVDTRTTTLPQEEWLIGLPYGRRFYRVTVP